LLAGYLGRLVEAIFGSHGGLIRGLLEHHFAVDVAHEGEDGLHRALAGEYDLLLVDVMLPRRDGWSILAELRRAGKQVPVLFLTARDAVPDRVRGLDAGADDYLCKPFAFEELLARVRALARRQGQTASTLLSYQDVRVDLAKDRIYLPLEDLAKFGLTYTDVQRQVVSEPFIALMKHEVKRARELFTHGKPLCLTASGRLGLELRAVWTGGTRILDRIEANGYDVFTRRPVITTSDKLRVMVNAASKRMFRRRR